MERAPQVVWEEYKPPTTRAEYLDEKLKQQQEESEWVKQRSRLRKPGYEKLDDIKYGGN